MTVAAPSIGRLRFAERLWPSAWVVGSMLALTAAFAVALLPAAGPAGVAAGGLGGGVLVLALVVWWTPRVRVVDVVRGQERAEPWLQAGSARIPVRALGEARARRDGQWREELGPAMDVRSHRCVRGWVRHGVRVAVDDPRDPVPYWLVSSRRPEALAAALTEARASVASASGSVGPEAERPHGSSG